MNPRVALAALLGVACPVSSSLWAHPGHGTTDPYSLVHQTAEWLHAAPWWLAVASVAAAGLLWRARRRLA